MTIQTKICGLTTPEAVKAAVEGGAAYAGFVFFARSPRNLAPEKAAALAADLPPSVEKVAVVVDASDAEIKAIDAALKPDLFQLHGKESVARIAEMRKLTKAGLIKAISVRSGDDVAAARVYQKVVDMLLFDARPPKHSTLPGGNGMIFDWELLADKHFSIPWMLSGGLNAENVAEAVRISGARAVDVSSSLEAKAGVKDPALVKEFLAITATL